MNQNTKEKVTSDLTTVDDSKDEKMKTVKYRKYTDDDLKEHLSTYYNSPLPLREYLKTTNCIIPRTTFHKACTTIGLKEKKLSNIPLEAVEKCIICYFTDMNKNEKYRGSKAGAANRYLTDNEEMAVMQIARLLGEMGGGLSKSELLKIVDEYVNQHEDDCMKISCSEKMLKTYLGSILTW
jgi:hypothetical protein